MVFNSMFVELVIIGGKIFLQKGHLNRHTRNVHEGKKPGDNSISEVTNESEIA